LRVSEKTVQRHLTGPPDRAASPAHPAGPPVIGRADAELHDVEWGFVLFGDGNVAGG
jgi:hypothetical protein